MKVKLYHEINYHPEIEYVGTIRINAKIICEDDNILTFKTSPTTEEFIDEAYESLELFLMEESELEVNFADLRRRLCVHIEEATSTSWYSLEVWLELDLLSDDDDVDNDDYHIQEAAQVSFDETSNVRFRPANKLVVESLIRKIYKTKTKKEETNMNNLEEVCAICLQEFANGARVVPLPCGHDFDDECIVKWFETSHVCPVCRSSLPCEEDQ